MRRKVTVCIYPLPLRGDALVRSSGLFGKILGCLSDDFQFSERGVLAHPIAEKRIVVVAAVGSRAIRSSSVRPGSISTSKSMSLFGRASPRTIDPNTRTFARTVVRREFKDRTPMCVQRFERHQPMIATRLGCTNGRALSMALGSGAGRLAGGCAVGVTGSGGRGPTSRYGKRLAINYLCESN
jgi:hypothetical protein